jgi:CO/xanthine dehydrogenase FAD-binding subunit
MVAANLRIDRDRRIREAAICVGSCSAKAVRLPELERTLLGATAESAAERLAALDASAISPIDDIRATAEYRREAAETLVTRALTECAKKAF